MSFGNLLKLSYWFSISTPPFGRTSLIIAAVILGVVFLGAVALRIAAKRFQGNAPLTRGLVRLSRPLFFLSIMGFLLFSFRELGAAILGARFWVALILLISIVWIVLVERSFLKTYRFEYEKIKQVEKYKEYLPKRKTK